MAAKPKKPILPAEADALIADSAWASLSGMGEDVIAAASGDFAALVAKTRDAAATVDLVRSQQPHLLEAYADDLLGVVNRTLNLNSEDAALMVMGLLSSTTLARILADVANGNIEPVAATSKKRKPRTAKPEAPAEEAPAPAEVPAVSVLDQPVPADEIHAAPAPRKRTAKPKAEPAPEPAPVPEAPVVSPGAVTDPDADTVQPGDFDDFVPPAPEPSVEPALVVDAAPNEPDPAPAPVDPVPAAPEPAPATVGGYNGPVGDDDF